VSPRHEKLPDDERGDVDEATIQELVRKSPVYDTLANPVNIKIEVEKV
jgi:hypothetical protein